MKPEIEAKFIDIDPIDLRKRLKKIGATKKHSEVLTKRNVFDYSDNRLNKIGAWIRVRDNGDEKITLSYKRLIDRSLCGTQEIEVVVDSFEKTTDFLLACGFDKKAYQETKREKWVLGEAEITIDTWPWIPSFVEIEAGTEKEVMNISDKLGFNWEDSMCGSVENVYQRYYDVTEAEVDSWELITFSPIPDWLEIKKRHTELLKNKIS